VIALCQYFGVAEHFGSLVSAAPVGEAYANLRQRNQFASLTALGAAALLWRASRQEKDLLAAPAMVLLVVANAASASRTGLLQLLMLTVFTAFWGGANWHRRVTLCVIAGAAYVGAATLLPPLLEAATGVVPANIWGRLNREEGCASRLVLWSNVLHLIAQKPWLGWGWGELDYAHYITLYPGTRFCDILDNAHNLPLHLAVELGVPVATVICGTFLWWSLRQRPWRETDATRQLGWSVVAVILLHSMLEYPLWYGPFQLAFVLSLGLLLRPLPFSNPAAKPWISSAARAALALVTIVGIAFAGWDYRRVSQIYLQPEARAEQYRDDTLAHIRSSWLFRDQARFAELTITPLTRDNAQWTLTTASALLHFSPEPRVIEKVIESATMLGRDDLARAHLARLRAAFPEEYARWKADRMALPSSQPPAGLRPGAPALRD
jgi:hypothetical protein